MIRHKYPSTPHIMLSPGYSSDSEKLFRNLKYLMDGVECVITEKLDGQNNSLYYDGFHARSLDSKHHESQDWLKNYHAKFAYEIPDGWRICVENLYARHSIAYENLSTYCYVLNVWNHENIALPWNDTLKFCEKLNEAVPGLNLQTAPQLYRGEINDRILTVVANSIDTRKQEGFVIRPTHSISYEDWDKYVCKWVRKDHVQTDQHWKAGKMITNQLKPEARPKKSWLPAAWG